MASSNDPDAALAGMARIGNPRVPMGNAAYSVLPGAEYTPSPNTTLVPKQGDQSGDPTPPTAIRTFDRYKLPAGSGDHDGAAYRTIASFPSSYPSATSGISGQTQANGRVLKPSVTRSTQNFGDGFSDSL